MPAAQKTIYDADVSGFGIRITPGGSRSFILNYRTRAGRERRYTIGGFPAWTTAAARKFAAEMKARIRLGHDPLGELEAERGAPTIAMACRPVGGAEYLDRLRPATAEMYRLLIDGPKPKPGRGKPRAAASRGCEGPGGRARSKRSPSRMSRRCTPA